MSGFLPFKSWDEVLDYVEERGFVWYHAPLSVYPASCKAEVIDGNRVRLTPAPYLRMDPFVRTASELAMFLKPGDRSSDGFRAAYAYNGGL